MNLGISVLFRAIPLIMGVICLFYGLDILQTTPGAPGFIAGHVLVALAAICLALFTTAAVIIRQLVGAFSPFWKCFLPALGYGGAIVTVIFGLITLSAQASADAFVAGHLMFGIGLIAACVSTVAAASACFTLIPINAAGSAADGVPTTAYSGRVGACLIAVPVVCTVVGLIWSAVLLGNAEQAPHYVAGNVLLGLSLICASLIALVATVVRQVRNAFGDTERWYWSLWVVAMGTLCVLLGILVLAGDHGGVRIAPGIVLIGIGMICYSIVSKVWLLALVWRRHCALANRIPLIPVLTCLSCLFAAAFLAQAASLDPNFFIPSRVMTGLGAVCFTLFSIVSILEAGTSGNKS